MDKKELQIQKHMKKSFSFEREKESEDLESRVMTFSFASEVPYLRYFGYEIIDMASMNLERINSKAQLLFNHDEDEYIGVVEKAWTDANAKKAYATVRFSKNALGEQVFRDIQDGIISNVSFGYDCYKATSLGQIDGIDAYRFSVKPFELSFVTIPADYSVGMNRSNESEGETLSITVENLETENATNDQSTNEENKEPENNNTENKETDIDLLAKEKEKNHNSSINNQKSKMDKELIEKIQKLSKEYNCLDLGMEAIANGTSFEDFQNEILKRSATNHSAFIKTNENNKVKKSILGRALKELADGSVSTDTRNKEKEICEQNGLLKRSASNSVMLRLDDLVGQKRNVTVANPASAGILTEEGVDGSFLTALSKELVVEKLGARIIQATGHNSFRIPTAGVLEDYSDAYKAELADGVEYEMNLTQSTLQPHTLQIFTRVTREIMMQSELSIESIVASEMQRALVEAMNKAVLVGPGGATKVLGFFNSTGVQVIDAAEPTRALTLEMQDIVQDNLGSVNETSSKFLANYATASRFASTQQANALPFVYDVNTGRMTGREVVKSGLVPNLKLAYGDFSNFVIGIWNGVELMVNPYHYKNGDLLITATVTFDAKVVRPSAFVIANIAPVTP